MVGQGIDYEWNNVTVHQLVIFSYDLKKEMTMFIYRCVHAGRLLPGSDNMTLDDMNNLVSIVEQKMKDISGRFEAIATVTIWGVRHAASTLATI